MQLAVIYFVFCFFFLICFLFKLIATKMFDTRFIRLRTRLAFISRRERERGNAALSIIYLSVRVRERFPSIRFGVCESYWILSLSLAFKQSSLSVRFIRRLRNSLASFDDRILYIFHLKSFSSSEMNSKGSENWIKRTLNDLACFHLQQTIKRW